MNTYYLKKFRKEAYKLFGTIWYKETTGNGLWNVGRRKGLKPSYTLAIWGRYDKEEDAIKALGKLRRDYILTKVRGIRYDKKLRKYNKQLAKL